MKAQYDPVIQVVPDTGAVYAAMLNGDRHNGFSTAFTKSTDHGRTWSAPVHVYGSVSWTDKPEIATSASGKDVYISWNGPEGGDLYVGESHDYGATWTQQKLSDSKRYYYAYDGRVLADGTVVFSESSLEYAGAKNVQGEVWHHVVISRDGGTTWEDRSWRRCRSARTASPTAASRTSTSARPPSPPTLPVTSSSRMRVRRPTSGRSGSM